MKKIPVILVVGYMLHGCAGGASTSPPTPREQHRAAITKEVGALHRSGQLASQKAWSCKVSGEPKCEAFWVNVIEEVKSQAQSLEREVKSERQGQAHRAGA